MQPAIERSMNLTPGSARVARTLTDTDYHTGDRTMRRKRFMLSALIGAFTVLSLLPVNAEGQLGGLVNRAKKAVHPDQPASRPTNDRNGPTPITSEKLSAYIKGERAMQTEAQRLDSLESLSTATPQQARVVAVMSCQVDASAKANKESPAQAHADSMLLRRQFAGVDTVKMKKLGAAAQSGDAAAMAQLQALAMQRSRRLASDPQLIALRQRTQTQALASMKASQACEKDAPPASTYAGPIAHAKAEIAKYGDRLSQTRNAHLESVKLQAANGMSPTEFAAIDERIRVYMASSTEPTQGFSSAELQLLRPNRAQLGALDIR
jgi:hypothetical protein